VLLIEIGLHRSPRRQLKEAIVEWTAQHSGNAGEARKGISLQAIKVRRRSNAAVARHHRVPVIDRG
jgi:hypothetical protein